MIRNVISFLSMNQTDAAEPRLVFNALMFLYQTTRKLSQRLGRSVTLARTQRSWSR